MTLGRTGVLAFEACVVAPERVRVQGFVNSEDVRREDIEGDEAWHRTTNEPDIRLDEAIRNDDPPGWQVGVAVMEFVREGDPPYEDLRQAIEAAIGSVAGVTALSREDTEVWWVTGSPTGEELTKAVARVLDDRADLLRAFYNSR